MSDLKWAKTNKGNVVLTDGDIYVGFAEKEYSSRMLSVPFSNYSAYELGEIGELGIDKITEWKEIEL